MGKAWIAKMFGHMMRMKEAFLKIVNEGRTEGGGVRGRPPVKCVRVLAIKLEDARLSMLRECQNWEIWTLLLQPSPGRKLL